MGILGVLEWFGGKGKNLGARGIGDAGRAWKALLPDGEAYRGSLYGLAQTDTAQNFRPGSTMAPLCLRSAFAMPPLCLRSSIRQTADFLAVSEGMNGEERRNGMKTAGIWQKTGKKLARM